MNETDARLAGDPVWELFPYPTCRLRNDVTRLRKRGAWLSLIGVMVLGSVVIPPVAVVVAFVAYDAQDFQKGRQLARTMPGSPGGMVGARFFYSSAAFAMIFAPITISRPDADKPRGPAQFVSPALLMVGGFASSAVLTALGFVAADRTGMRVWIDEGVNRARTLFMNILIVGFT